MIFFILFRNNNKTLAVGNFFMLSKLREKKLTSDVALL